MLCLIVRWQLSNGLDGNPSRIARGHLSRCEHCRTFAARLHDLHGELAGAAIAAPLPRVASRRLPGRLLWAFGVPVAFATAVIVVLALPSGTPPSPPAPIDTPVASVDVLVGPTVAVRRSGTAVVAAATAWLDAAPLHHELAALEADVRRGASIALRIPPAAVMTC